VPHHDFDTRVLVRSEESGSGEAAREEGVDPPPEALAPWPEVIKVGPQIGATDDIGREVKS
jgi:hypothetical protein